MLAKHELPILKEEAERVDTVRYSWQKLMTQAAEVSTYLIQIQPQFKSELIENVEIFVQDCGGFYGDYRTVSISILKFYNLYAAVW